MVSLEVGRAVGLGRYFYVEEEEVGEMVVELSDLRVIRKWRFRRIVWLESVCILGEIKVFYFIYNR